jgi:hypothetical protein
LRRSSVFVRRALLLPSGMGIGQKLDAARARFKKQI